MARKIRMMIVSRDEAGLTNVVILGRIGRRREEVVTVEMYASVRMNWFTNWGCIWPLSVLRNATPLNMPSPSNQCASLPRSSLVTGFPPFRTYSPPARSCGIEPLYEQAVRG